MKKLLLITITLTFFSCATNERVPANFQTCLEMMNHLIMYKPFEGPAADAFTSAKSLQELESFYGGESLIELQREFTGEEIKASNEVLKNLVNMPYRPKKIAGKKVEIFQEDSEVIYKAMAQSKVHKNHDCYDTKGTIGFCFGRATIAHMEAIIRNVHPESVKKIWIAGDMDKWGHHVATIIYTERGWMVLDTEMAGPVDVKTWIDTCMKWKKTRSKELMIFITQAGRYGPYDNRAYNAVDLFNTTGATFDKSQDYFKGYFYDYFQHLDEKSKKIIEEQLKERRK